MQRCVTRRANQKCIFGAKNATVCASLSLRRHSELRPKLVTTLFGAKSGGRGSLISVALHSVTRETRFWRQKVFREMTLHDCQSFISLGGVDYYKTVATGKFFGAKKRRRKLNRMSSRRWQFPVHTAEDASTPNDLYLLLAPKLPPDALTTVVIKL